MHYVTPVLFSRDTPYSLNGFTPGKHYAVCGRKGNGVLVRNDNGHERFLLPGEPSGHLVAADGLEQRWGWHHPIGVFLLCEEG